jgi:hypothetical protein
LRYKPTLQAQITAKKSGSLSLKLFGSWGATVCWAQISYWLCKTMNCRWFQHGSKRLFVSGPIKQA